MDCDYWKDIVRQLYDPSRCNWASHVLSTLLGSDEALEDTNLGMALKCVSEDEIIRAAIHAYCDWDSQPYCDLILQKFDMNKIESVFRQIEAPDSNMENGVRGLLEIMTETM